MRTWQLSHVCPFCHSNDGDHNNARCTMDSRMLTDTNGNRPLEVIVRQRSLSHSQLQSCISSSEHQCDHPPVSPRDTHITHANHSVSQDHHPNDDTDHHFLNDWPDADFQTCHTWPKISWFGHEHEQPTVVFKERRVAIANGLQAPHICQVTTTTKCLKRPRILPSHSSTHRVKPIRPSRLRGPTVYPRNLLAQGASKASETFCDCCSLHTVPASDSSLQADVHDCQNVCTTFENRVSSPCPNSQPGCQNCSVESSSASPPVFAVIGNPHSPPNTLSTGRFSARFPSFASVRTVFVNSPQNTNARLLSDLQQSVSCGVCHFIKGRTTNTHTL